MERADTTGPERSLKPISIWLAGDIEIRQLRRSDSSAVYTATIANREHLEPWMSWANSMTQPPDTYAFLLSTEREALARKSFSAGIWHEGELLGAIDLHDIDWINRSARIGYWLAQRHTGKGIMTNAVQALVKYAFEALDLHRLEIRAATGNHRSRRIPERLGFTLEGILRDAQFIAGTYLDHALYALVRET